MPLPRCPVRKVRVGAPRRGLELDARYLKWIRSLPCVCCGTTRYVEAAHVGVRGLGQKCSDRETLPLCSWHHVQGPESNHVLGKRFFEFHNLDRTQLIDTLNANYEQENKTMNTYTAYCWEAAGGDPSEKKIEANDSAEALDKAKTWAKDGDWTENAIVSVEVRNVADQDDEANAVIEL